MHNKSISSFLCHHMNIKQLHRESLFADLTNSANEKAIFTKLSIVSLNNNKITTLDVDQFKMLTHISTIGLYNNLLTVIHPKTFIYNIRLLYIDLADNLISEFNLNFNYIPYLQFLLLDNNNITTLKESVFKAYFYFDDDQRFLYINNNKLTCDCSMVWIYKHQIDVTLQLYYDEFCLSDVSKLISLTCFFFNSKYSIRNDENCITNEYAQCNNS